MFDFEERVLIGWLANTVREPANQAAYLKVQHFCFYVEVVYHFRPEYSIYGALKMPGHYNINSVQLCQKNNYKRIKAILLKFMLKWWDIYKRSIV